MLTDVTVTDAHGQRVSGLKASDFLVTDDDKPVSLASFTEHVQEQAKPLDHRSSDNLTVYSNALFVHPPPVLNIILVDITNLEIVDQLYLNFQLTKLLHALPAGEPVALYWCRQSNAILLQEFTSEHAKLLAALHKAIPRIPPPGREYLSSANILHQLAISLAQLPGRKNVLWFSGGSANLATPFSDLVSVSSDEEAALHTVYDELESSRITVYPFDARGLVTSPGPALLVQQQLMRQMAEKTGGHAFVNTNGLEFEASHLIASDGAYYTLTYAPKDFKADGKWHNVRVSIAIPNTSLQLSYRRGYYADDPAKPRHPRGLPEKVAAAPGAAAPDRQSAPIPFQLYPIRASGGNVAFAPARISLPLDPSQQKRGSTLYALRYTVPLDAFTVARSGDHATVTLGIAVVAFGEYGTITFRRAEQVVLNLNPQKLPLQAGDAATVDQQVALPKGDTTLFCAVWDRSTGRLGTLQIPVTLKDGALQTTP